MEKVNPTCVLKVNLQCCKACPDKVKKQLKKVKGVTHIDIDIQKKLITVSGVADASILIKAIEKVGRKAELCKFEKQTKHKEDSKDNHSTSKCNCNEVDVHAGHATRPVPPHPYGRPKVPPPPFYARPPPPPPPPPPHPCNYYQPRPLPPPMPQRPTYTPGELNHGYGPADNNIFHAFDDLNVNSCNIS